MNEPPTVYSSSPPIVCPAAAAASTAAAAADAAAVSAAAAAGTYLKAAASPAIPIPEYIVYAPSDPPAYRQHATRQNALHVAAIKAENTRRSAILNQPFELAAFIRLVATATTNRLHVRDRRFQASFEIWRRRSLRVTRNIYAAQSMSRDLLSCARPGKCAH